MDALQEVERLLADMPRADKAQVLQWIARDLGATEADLLRNYPTLRAEDLANAWAYYRVHSAEIEAQIIENETA